MTILYRSPGLTFLMCRDLLLAVVAAAACTALSVMLRELLPGAALVSVGVNGSLFVGLSAAMYVGLTRLARLRFGDGVTQ